MNMRADIALPAAFIEQRVRLTAAETAKGMELGWLDPDEAAKLTPHSQCDEGDPVRVWAFLAAAWILDHKDDYKDPWWPIEQVWEDLDHFDELSGLIRWMPALDDGFPRSIEGMEARWRSFVETTGREFAARA